jgi:hypothetical protein
VTIADVIAELADHGFGNTVSSTRQIWFINDTIWDICSRERWPFLEKTVNLTFAGGSATATNWPSDFKAALSMINTSTGTVVSPERQDFVDKRNILLLTQAGSPVFYSFVGSGGTSAGDAEAPVGDVAVANFWPIPLSSDTLTMRYLAQHPQVTAGTTESGILIPPQHHRVISLGSIWKCLDLEDDPNLAMRYQNLYETRIESMKRDVFIRQYDRPDRVYVIGYDDNDSDFYW